MKRLQQPNTAVCVFAYNRPKHLLSCLLSLSKNDESRQLDLRLYVDAPRHQSDFCKHQEVIGICNRSWPFSNVSLIQRDENLGLYKSLVGGITETLLSYESVIVLEDDIVSSPFLVRYLLDGLKLYKDFPQVASIHGYTPPVIQRLPDTFFLRGADCWGWATWQDRWNSYRHDSAAMANEIRQRGLVKEFNLNGNYDYLSLLDAHAAGSSKSWAICWHASCFLSNMITLYPGKSLVKNIGLDGSGEHCGPSKVMNSEASQKPVLVENIPLQVDKNIYAKYCDHFSSSKDYPNLLYLLLSKIKYKLRHFFSRPTLSKLTLTGPYGSYEEALSLSSGYNSNAILDKVYSAVVNVLNGSYAYERDGSIFTKRPSIDNLRRILISQLKYNDSVVDFGGGLGGTFINNRDIFNDLINYTVIEQYNFVEVGLKLYINYKHKPHFVDNINSLPGKPDIVIISSVLQYIPNAEYVLLKIAELMPRLIILDRTALSNSSDDEKWWIQHEPTYYQIPTSYPIRPLFLQTILSLLEEYLVVETWQNSFDRDLPPHRGFLLRRKV